MKRVFGICLVGLVAVGTSSWAQQSDEQGTTKSVPSADGRDKPAKDKPNESVDESAPARAGVRPTLPSAASARVDPNRPGSGYPYVNSAPQTVAPTAPPTYYQVPTWAPYQNSTYYQLPSPYPAGIAPTSPYLPAAENESTQKFRQAIRALHAAKTNEEKAEVREKLNELVSKQLDEDFVEREKRLSELEAKTKQLREQLQERRQTKAEIQKMLVMLIENPQGGLGLPPAWMNVINQQGLPPQMVFPAPTQPLSLPQ